MNFDCKNVGSEVFLMKLKHQYHLSHQGERVYGAQLRKEKRLSWEFVFVPIDKQTLILKMVGKKAFLMKQKH